MYKEFLLKEIFEPHQGNAIYTKKAIISNGWEGNVPVISSDTNNNGILCYISNEYVKKKDYIDYPCITWTVDGQAGTLKSRFTPFVPNNHCGYLIPKREDLYLPYLEIVMQPLFYQTAKNSSNKKVGNNQIENLLVRIPVNELENPDISIQKQLADKYFLVQEQKQNLLEKVKELSKITVALPEDETIKWGYPLVTDLFYPKGGNAEYTKVWVSENQGNIPLYSGTTTGEYAKIDKADYNGEYLTWCIDGLAGYIMYHNEAFSLTCHRGVLLPTEKCVNVDLRYIKFVLEPIFRSRKKGREGDMGKNEYTALKPIAIKRMKDVIPIPVREDGTYDIDKQRELADKYEQIAEIKQNLINRIMELTEIVVI